MSGKGILVVGARGFIGATVATALEAYWPGCVRRGFTRPSLGQGVRCDLMDPDSLRAAMQGASAVVNCARSPAGLANARAAARNLAEAALSSGVSKIIFLSSIAVYGGTTGDINEDTPPASALNGYATEKLATEEILKQASGTDLHVVVLRPGLVYGRNGAEWFDHFIAGPRLSHLRDLGEMGHGYANLVHVEDLAQFCVELVRRPLPEYAVANVVGDDVISFNQYFATLAVEAGAPPPPPRAEGRGRWSRRRLVRKIARKLASKVPINAVRRAVASGPKDDAFDQFSQRMRFSTDRARELGFSPAYTVEAGVRQAITESNPARERINEDG